MPRKISGKISIGLLALLVIAAASGIYAARLVFADASEAQPAYKALKVYPQPKVLKNIQLVDKNGQPLTEQSLVGDWTLAFFGYTHCPDVCPTTLADMQALEKKIHDSGVKSPKVLFVSVDPERDQPQQLKRWIDFFNPDFQAATGTTEAIEHFTRQVGAAYFIGKHAPGDTNYPVDHTAAIFLLDPQGRLYGLFTSPHRLPDMAEDLIALAKKKPAGTSTGSNGS